MRRILCGAALGGVTALLVLPGAAAADPSGSPSASPSPSATETASPSATATISPASPVGSVSPETVQPGGHVTFSLVCAVGVRSADVAGAVLGLDARIPMTPGTTSGVFTAAVDLPSTINEGTFLVSLDCADGTSSVVQLVVSPSGGVPTGGGSTTRGVNRALMAAGGSMLVVGAAGAMMLRRRPDGTP
ncbi:hypothetical protein KZZ52_10865 [Dactylosporangium sp. AC04546]|uniref:hypothetical protein n=1 Tax=Dactylosporangium sp. AC04546 TaxID=2862460 RepID=UPI001EE0F08E|nr:hypothetical protein [Dactylosporangium sp. AC04546]WVK85857.1 hypothetical protein KZZ52_10865 [Dactylosporangium sp. AC04546]